MTTINDFVDAVYIINLARRTDRWERVSKECEKQGIQAERFEAYDGVLDHNGKPNAVLGCAASHRALMDVIAYKGHKRAMIMEDDAVFRFDPESSQEMFSAMIGEVPMTGEAAADLIYLGCSYSEKPQYRHSNHVIRTGRCLCLHTYIVTGKFAREVAPYIGGGGGTDNAAANFAYKKNFYSFEPRLTAQGASFSDLQGIFTDNTGNTTDGRWLQVLDDDEIIQSFHARNSDERKHS